VANEKMREYWATGADGWVQHKELFDAELAPFAELLIDTLAPGPGTRLLDIGCGTGTLLGLAAARGATGLGVDISPSMIETAIERVPRASFVVADAQTDDLAAHGPFDAMMSRFGVMFFDDPTAAFANIRTAAVPGAPLAFVCWRSIEENAMFSLGTSVIIDRMVPKPEPPPPGAPGPTAFADADRVRGHLDAAGWHDVDVQPFDVMLDYGRDGSDGVEERLTMILGTSAGNIARREIQPYLTADEWAALLDEVRAELRRHLVDGRVQFNAATWLVTARNPPS
jgi:SAM-dependent methyltransferase